MRLIDADEALRLFGEEYEETKELIHNGETHLDSLAEGFTEAYHIIKYVLPTIDAVPVVRCKDCENSYYVVDGLICSYGPCVAEGYVTWADIRQILKEYGVETALE